MPAPTKRLRPLHAKGRRGVIARRVCVYVNEHFGGNMTRAARELGCPYIGLRAMAQGTAVRPVVPVIQALAVRSGLSIEHWLSGRPKGNL